MADYAHTTTVRTPPDRTFTYLDGPGISAGLEKTLANIKQILDGSSTEPA